MASPKALLEWCRATCAPYPGVEIKNTSSSFRDGLAFCAIIHKHRPDLIDFSSLSRENVYQNNKLAFETADAKLGIPPLLDPKDMVSPNVPDFLSVITYISHYYNFFSGRCHGPSRLRSSHVLNITKVQKTLKSQKSLTDPETSTEDGYANSRTRAVCHLCFKPVHLIQRHLIDGKVYHRSCFRCTVCRCVLLPSSYTQGSDTTSLICSHHATDRKAAGVDGIQRFRCAENQPECPMQTGFYSLSGLAICSVPRYTQRAGLVSKTQQTEETERPRGNNRESVSVENPRPPEPCDLEPTVRAEDRNRPEVAVVNGKGQKTASKTSELSLSSKQETEGSAYPVPAPRRSGGSYVVPVPAPRSRTAQTMSSSPAAETPSEPSPHPSHTSSPKVKSNHPWMTIVHPGPWTLLPPVPPPVPLPRSKSVSNTPTPWNKPRFSPPNPFDEEEEVDEVLQEAPEHESANQTRPSAPAVIPEKSDITRVDVCEEKTARESEPNTGERQDGQSPRGHVKKEHDGREADPPMGGTPDSNSGGSGGEPTDGGQTGSSDATEAAAAEARFSSAQSSILPRSLSVPAIPSERSETSSVLSELHEASLSVSSSENKSTCTKNQFAQQPEMSRSKTVQNLSSTRGPAPGHGFPLIRRQVRTDQGVSTEDLHMQMRDLDGRLEVLEKRGVELEKNIRDSKTGKEEQMLTEWFTLIREQHALLCKNKELFYLTKQQMLEDRQADVEYDLRCLLNKPEKDWSEEDRGREERLMAELVTIIEQRNQIISILDQDRERDGDIERTSNKGFQKEGLKELKKSKGKLKASKVFKMLNHKTESSKEPVDKKS
ncbi:MICAL-like protein 1 [Fundulus diaphanus]